MPSIATPLFAGDLHDTALRLAQAQSASARGSEDATAGAWRQMLQLGWPAVLVPEDHGGAGAALEDFAAIVEALATQALTVPLIDRCAVAPALLASAAGHASAAALLQEVAGGGSSAASALHTAPQQRLAVVPILVDGSRLGAAQLAIDWSVPATHVVFDARRASDGATVLVLLSAQDVVPRLRRFVGLDGSTTAVIDLEGLSIEPDQVLLSGPAAAQAVDAAHQLGSLLGCVRTVGACGAMIEQTIEYLNTRTQFGAQLSTFQALRHRTVEMYVAYENARGLVRDQVLRHAADPQARQVALTRLYVQGVGRNVGEATIQLHGGMGMSQETLAARLAMHALMSALNYGEPADCLDWLAAGMSGEPRNG